ncbi:MAG: hypothetical protein IPN60_20915 [Saprospiraceae bacterium]|nr:hypothetical protein [Candidatus Opimibacter skivensis]
MLGYLNIPEQFCLSSFYSPVRKVNRYTFIALLLSLLTFVESPFLQLLFKPVVASDAQPAFLNINMYIILAVMLILLVQAIYGVIKRVKNARSFLLFYILILISGFASSMFTDLGIDLDQSTALSYVFFTPFILGLMLITSYYF